VTASYVLWRDISKSSTSCYDSCSWVQPAPHSNKSVRLYHVDAFCTLVCTPVSILQAPRGLNPH
jgi:hypothetical protein